MDQVKARLSRTAASLLAVVLGMLPTLSSAIAAQVVTQVTDGSGHSGFWFPWVHFPKPSWQSLPSSVFTSPEQPHIPCQFSPC